MVICLPAKWLVVICVLNESIQNGTLQREWCVECIELYQDHHCWDGFFVSSCVCDHSSNSLEWLGEASKIHLVLFTQVEIILQHTGDGLESSQFWPFGSLVLYLCISVLGTQTSVTKTIAWELVVLYVQYCWEHDVLKFLIFESFSVINCCLRKESGCGVSLLNLIIDGCVRFNVLVNPLPQSQFVNCYEFV